MTLEVGSGNHHRRHRYGVRILVSNRESELVQAGVGITRCLHS